MKVRRNTGYEQAPPVLSKEIDLNSYKTERGFFSVPSDIWEKLTPSDMKYVKDFNGKLRKKREYADPTGRSKDETKHSKPYDHAE